MHRTISQRRKKDYKKFPVGTEEILDLSITIN